MPRKAFPLRSSRGRLLLCADFLAQNSVLIRYGTKHNAKGGSYFCRLQLLFSYFYYPLSKQKKHIHSQESLSMHFCCLYDIAQCLRCISLLLQLHNVPSCEIRYVNKISRSGVPICSLRFADICVNTFALHLYPLHIFLY